jgi:hypothetical protein
MIERERERERESELERAIVVAGRGILTLEVTYGVSLM